MKRFYLKICLTLLFALTFSSLHAQRFSVGTNGVDWLTLGTINAEASIAVAQQFSVHVGGELNPWTWIASDPEKEFRNRQYSVTAGVRWWPWHVYSGWWVGNNLRYSLYNSGGIFNRQTEEGDAYGMGFYGGYSIMLTDMWNLDIGIGAWGGWKQYTTYACPTCGVKLDQGGKVFVIPDARVAIQLIF